MSDEIKLDKNGNAIHPEQGKHGELVDPDVHAQIMSTVEELLTAGMSPAQVCRAEPIKLLGVRAKNVPSYIQACYAQWAEDNKVDRDAKRSHMVEMIHHQIQAAMSHERTWYDKQGVLRSRLEPNFNAVARLMEVLCRVHGVIDQNAPSTLPVVHETVLNVLNQHYYGAAQPPAPPQLVESTAEPIDLTAVVNAVDAVPAALPSGSVKPEGRS